jgi:hypothetical protein
MAVMVAAILYEGLKTLRQWIKEKAVVQSRTYRERDRSVTPTDDDNILELTSPLLSP